jgi:hypothetical protein
MDSSMSDGSLSSELAALDAKLNALLPPRYQHCYETVAPTSMGSAGLIYGPDGKVAWDRIWTSFCDLAMAGGPPHRGKLLEPTPEAEAVADQARYWDVVSEIDRAIGLTTCLPVVGGYTVGWVGVHCGSVEEASWLQFAVTAENVSARRRKAVLQLPAGPAFRPEKEIKNVVVALAKSCHYWEGHLTDSQQTLVGEEFWEPASPSEAAARPAEYEAALREVEAGLREAGCAEPLRRYVGWVGVETWSEEDAVWLLRAVLVEKVLARREENVLFLPVGPRPDPEQSRRVVAAFRQAWRLWTAVRQGRPGTEAE